MTVAEINALLYSTNHARDQLERALRIAALSPGWRGSFEALLQSPTTGGASGNAGLVPAAAAHPVAPGFRPLKVMAIDQESADVLSLTMQSPDQRPLQTERLRCKTVESVFQMIKSKFGERLRSKTATAQVNEALTKVLAHNLCVVI